MDLDLIHRTVASLRDGDTAFDGMGVHSNMLGTFGEGEVGPIENAAGDVAARA